MFVAYGLIILLCLFVDLIYRKYWRRLVLSQNFMGPPALPLLGNSLDLLDKKPEEYAEIVNGFIEKYGDIFRVWIGPELNLLVSDLKFVEHILGSNTLIDKAGEYDVLRPWLREGLLVSTGKKWFKRRKIITPAFHFKVLDQFIDVFDTQSGVLMEILKSLESRDCVNMLEYIKVYTLDVLCGMWRYLFNLSYYDVFEIRYKNSTNYES